MVGDGRESFTITSNKRNVTIRERCVIDQADNEKAVNAGFPRD